jgi:uncharacterized protein
MSRLFPLVLFLSLSCSSFSPSDAAKPAAPSAPAPTPSPTQDPTAENYVGPALPHAAVVLSDAYGGVHRLDVEVAADGVSRTRGMMWRKSLEAGKGMLFVFPVETVQSFWMRNTLISLDMLFIAESGDVVGILERAEPRSLNGRSVGKPSRYVLEVPGGWVASKGIRAGSKAKLIGVDSIAVK